MRHELKHRITYEDYLIIKSRLRHIMKPDAFADADGSYRVHSLYFDTPSDKALREKIDGTDKREKFRIRYYNDSTGYIRLEKKIKIHELCSKAAAPLTKEQVTQLCRNDNAFLISSSHPLLKEFYAKMTYQLLRPKVIVDYVREPYVYAPGNVRVTFDSSIRTSIYANVLFDGPLLTAPTEPDTMIMELKYDAFLPEIIEKAVRVPDRQKTAFSKYAVCRMYG